MQCVSLPNKYSLPTSTQQRLPHSGSTLTLSRPQVPLLQKICYGAVSFSTLSLSLLINAFGIDFYVQLGALLPVISLFTAIARSFDIVTDLSMGWFSDNFRSPYGRRRPFMALGCIPYGLCFFFFFLPPITADSFGISLYFGLFYTAFYLSDTIATVPYDALGPELSTNYKVLSPYAGTAGLLFHNANPGNDGPCCPETNARAHLLLPQERNTIFFIARLFQLSGSVVVSITPAIMQSVLVSMGWTTLSATRTSLAITGNRISMCVCSHVEQQAYLPLLSISSPSILI